MITNPGFTFVSTRIRKLILKKKGVHLKTRLTPRCEGFLTPSCEVFAPRQQPQADPTKTGSRNLNPSQKNKFPNEENNSLENRQPLTSEIIKSYNRVRQDL